MNPEQLKQEQWKRSILLWMNDNKIVTENSVLFEFKDHRFLKDIINDWTPIQTCQKSSQIGFSTAMILKSDYAANYKKWNIIYSLPTWGDMAQFVGSKVNPIIKNNDILSEWTKDKDTISQKQVGDNFIFYRGASSGKSKKEMMESGTGIMLSADLLIHDESDRSNQMILEQYQSRLGFSKYGGKWYFSNPTTPHTITQQLWNDSDQKHWFVDCKRCGHQQYLDYYKNVDKIKQTYICSKCFKPLSDEDRRMGYWVRKYNNKDISGYWISHMMAPWLNAKYLIDSEAKNTKQYFHNFNLGLPYQGSDVVVDKETILKNIIYDEPNIKVENVIGVDTGLTMTYVIGNKQGIFKRGATKDWDEIEFLMKKYQALAVFDGLGDLTKPRKLRDKYRGRVWLTYFKKDKDAPEAIKWVSEEMAVYCDRSKTIQRVIDDLVDGNIKFYEMLPEDLEDYIKHWQTLSQIEEEDSLGITRKVWQTSGENHYVFATIYYYLALLRAGKGEVIQWARKDKTPLEHDPQSPSPVEMAKKQNIKTDWRL